MAQKLLPDNARQISFIGKLLKDGRRGTAHGILEIDGVCEVDGKGNTVDEDKDPLA